GPGRGVEARRPDGRLAPPPQERLLQRLRAAPPGAGFEQVAGRRNTAGTRHGSHEPADRRIPFVWHLTAITFSTLRDRPHHHSPDRLLRGATHLEAQYG